MSNIITIKLKGGLGNFLFQVATGYAYSLRYNKSLILDINDVYVAHQNILSYKDNIFSKLNFVNSNITYNNFYQEKSFSFNDIPFFGGSVKLDGYFQTEKYFYTYKEQLIELFDFGITTTEKIKNKYKSFLNQKTCSVHIRRGDYLKHPDIHPTLSISYYNEAIDYFDNDTTFLFFSDDIDWCKQSFSTLDKKVLFIQDNTDFEDLYLMTICNNNIICNSTFSWWGAWLNKNDNKKVIMPNLWFGNKLKHYNTDDLCCDGWIKI